MTMTHDEVQAFEAWWREEQLKTFPKGYDISRLKYWGADFKPHAQDGWNARAVLATELNLGLRRIKRTMPPNCRATRMLRALLLALQESGVSSLETRFAMLWFLGLEDAPKQTGEMGEHK